jgi:hypothetical protein
MWVFIWSCLHYKEGVLLPAELRPLDECARLDAVTCDEKKYFFLGHMLDYSSHMEPCVWHFLLQCVLVLTKDTDCRSGLRLEKLLMIPGAAEQSNDEDLEDIDGFLLVHMFTSTKS